MTDITIDTIASGLAFPECPRWRDGRLWFSDIYRGVVLRLDPTTGNLERVVEVPGQPAGLGFLPDGDLIVASVEERRIYRLGSEGTLHPHADLHGIATWHLNDMTVDDAGRTYIGNYGDASAPPEPAFPADLAMVEADGTAHVVATEMMFANGMAITPDGSTLIVAETRATPARLRVHDRTGRQPREPAGAHRVRRSADHARRHRVGCRGIRLGGVALQ